MRRGPLLAFSFAALTCSCSVQLSGLGEDDVGTGSDAGSLPDTTQYDASGAPLDSTTPDFGTARDATDDDTRDGGTIGSDAGTDTAHADTMLASDAGDASDTRPDVVVSDVTTGEAIEECKPADVDLITNGSFETPVQARDTRTNSKEPGLLPGWKLDASDSSKFWLENGKPAGKTRTKDGAQSICLNSDGSGTSAIEQAFVTVVGARYELRFWFTDEDVAGPTDTTIKVEVGSEVRVIDRKTDTGFVEKSIVFRAFDTSTVVRFTDQSSSAMWLESPFIDLVSVHACK